MSSSRWSAKSDDKADMIKEAILTAPATTAAAGPDPPPDTLENSVKGYKKKK
ncbi:hypothetical protein U1Q18_011245, partial [Sarracenia purpurea var. burkii]